MKNCLVLSLLIAGVVALYVSSMRAKQTAEVAGGNAPSLQAHDGMLRAQVAGSIAAASVNVVETHEGAALVIESEEDACSESMLAQTYQICASHRLEAHRDSQCKVTLRHRSGECTHPK